jgi:MFS family permease
MQLSRGKVLFALAVLLAINTMNFYDRQIPGVVAKPLREELQLNNTQLGWLTPAFLALYAVIGIPLGWWADTGPRKRILAGGVALWSVFTALSGQARGFWSLFAARLGVGIGEASCAPTASSLIGDYFPAERRSRAISIFMLGLPLGLSLSSLISGRIGQTSWQNAFYVAALPGLILAVLCLFITEPARGGAEKPQTDEPGPAKSPGLSDRDGYAERAVDASQPPDDNSRTTPEIPTGAQFGAARRPGFPLLLVLSIPTMWSIILSGVLHNFNMYTIGSFMYLDMHDYHGLSVSGAGNINTLLYGVGGIGILLGGWACDRLARRRISGRLELSALSMVVCVPCFFIALQRPPGDIVGYTLWLLPGYTMLYIYYAGVYATIQDIVEPALRGTAMAMYFFAMYLVAAFGPVITGRLSDARAEAILAGADGSVTREQAVALGLHQAFYLVPILGGLLVVVLFAGARTVARDHEKLQKWMASQAKR